MSRLWATLEERVRPDLMRKGEETKAAVLRSPASQRSATAERFARAYQILDNLEASLSHLPFDQEDMPIGHITSSDAMMRGCCSLIQAAVMTDMRIGFSPAVLQKPPMPDMWSHVTSLHPLSSNETQLLGVHGKEFVVLLACAIRLNIIGQPNAALRIIHELHAHAAARQLASGEAWDLGGLSLTETDCRFALATVGVKLSRKLYRMFTKSHREEFPGAGTEQLSTSALLESVETFAKYATQGLNPRLADPSLLLTRVSLALNSEQCALAPARAVGYWNRAWVSQQSVAVRGNNGLVAAADCLSLLTRCYEAADAEDDDFLKAEARIECATCLMLGGAGIVGYKVLGHSVQVQRDMRSAASFPAGTGSFIVAGTPTTAARRALVANETRRGQEWVPISTIEAGEMPLVRWWEALQLFNAAMRPYDALVPCCLEHNVYGESSGWDVIESYLQHSARQGLQDGQYGVLPKGEPGIRGSRDHGDGNEWWNRKCASCGAMKSEAVPLKVCARCKHVWYCTPECQRADWKAGHKLACKAFN